MNVIVSYAHVKPTRSMPLWMFSALRFDHHVEEYRKWRAEDFAAIGNEGKSLVLRRARELGVPYSKIMSANRRRIFTEPRQLLMWEVYSELDWGLSRIGRLFNRDHTTVLHAIRKIEALKAAAAAAAEAIMEESR